MDFFSYTPTLLNLLPFFLFTAMPNQTFMKQADDSEQGTGGVYFAAHFKTQQDILRQNLLLPL